MSDFIPIGTCTKKHIIQGNELEDRTYSVEESLILRTLSYENAKMIKGGYITVVPDVKDVKPIFEQNIDTEYQSATTGGRGKTDCGPFTPNGSYREKTRYIYTFYLYNEVSLCYKKLIGKWMQTKLNRGAQNSEENTALNDYIVEEIIKNNNKQTDELIWNGDYGAPMKRISHYDGIMKKVYQAIGTGATKQKDKYVFSGVVSGDYIEGYAGGYHISEAFDTDIATTVGNVITVLAGLKNPMTNATIFTVASVGSPVNGFTAENNVAGNKSDIVLFVSDGTGMGQCGDAKVAGTGTVTHTVMQAWEELNAPHTTTYAALTTSNIIAKIQEIYEKILEQKPEVLDDPNFYFHMSTHAYGLMAIAMTKTTEGVKGLATLEENPPFGLPMVKQPNLKGSFVMGISADNVFFGTDLESDLDQAKQWVNIDHQEVRFRSETIQGVQIGKFNEVFCNLGGSPPVSFNTAQSEPKNA